MGEVKGGKEGGHLIFRAETSDKDIVCWKAWTMFAFSRAEL